MGSGQMTAETHMISIVQYFVQQYRFVTRFFLLIMYICFILLQVVVPFVYILLISHKLVILKKMSYILQSCSVLSKFAPRFTLEDGQRSQFLQIMLVHGTLEQKTLTDGIQAKKPICELSTLSLIHTTKRNSQCLIMLFIVAPLNICRSKTTLISPFRPPSKLSIFTGLSNENSSCL